MIISTWNVHGLTPAKSHDVLSLVRSSDLVCLIETWKAVNSTAEWHSERAIAPPVRGVNRKGGGMAILYEKSGSFKLVSTHAEPVFQFAHGIANDTPILAAYVAQRIPREDLQRFLQLASACLRVPGLLIGDLNARHNQ